MSGQTRWRRRPLLSRVIQIGALTVPALGGLGASLLAVHLLPEPRGLAELVLWWAGLLAISLAAVLVVDRLARLVLPLSLLLELSLIFPDRLPSRLRLAFRARRFGRLKAQIRAERQLPGRLGPEGAGTVLSLVAALGSHDRRTRRHSERVRAFSDLIAEEMGIPAGEREKLRWAALLHDVGKLAVAADILNKDSSPSGTEWESIYRHPLEGGRLVDPLRPWLGQWVGTIEQHHERWDGTGYPAGLVGEEIALGARIVAVADAYDTMTASRPYRTARSPDWARQELVRMAGTQFDPTVVRTFLSLGLGRPPGWLVGPLSVLTSILAGLRRLQRDGAVVTTALVALGTAGTTGVIGPPGWDGVVDLFTRSTTAVSAEVSARPPRVGASALSLSPPGQVVRFSEAPSEAEAPSQAEAPSEAEASQAPVPPPSTTVTTAPPGPPPSTPDADELDTEPLVELVSPIGDAEVQVGDDLAVEAEVEVLGTRVEIATEPPPEPVSELSEPVTDLVEPITDDADELTDPVEDLLP